MSPRMPAVCMAMSTPIATIFLEHSGRYRCMRGRAEGSTLPEESDHSAPYPPPTDRSTASSCTKAALRVKVLPLKPAFMPAMLSCTTLRPNAVLLARQLTCALSLVITLSPNESGCVNKLSNINGFKLCSCAQAPQTHTKCHPCAPPHPPTAAQTCRSPCRA